MAEILRRGFTTDRGRVTRAEQRMAEAYLGQPQGSGEPEPAPQVPRPEQPASGAVHPVQSQGEATRPGDEPMTAEEGIHAEDTRFFVW